MSSSIPERKLESSDDGEWTRSSTAAKTGGKGRGGPPKSPKRYVVWLLSRRDYSEKELKDRLLQKGCSQQDTTDAIEFAKKHGFQSDVRFTESKVRSKGPRLGDSRIKRELQQSGIEPEAAAKAIGQLNETAPERDRAIKAASRFRNKIVDGKLDDKLRAKIYRFLASRGFSSGAVKAAINDLGLPLDEAADL